MMHISEENQKRPMSGAWRTRAARGFALLLAACGAVSPVFGQSTNGPARPDYSTFKLITERNIFNPKRYARGPNRNSAPVRVSETFTLVGTMSYEKGVFAFFEGTRSEYRKVLKPGEEIAGYKVADIAPSCVKLASGSNEVQVLVGMQMRRSADEGTWRLGAAPDTAPAGFSTASSSYAGSRNNMAHPGSTNEGHESQPASDPGPEAVGTESPPDMGATNAPPDAAGGGDEDPVMKRLRERREQELNR